ncbi:hypothetical protein [Acrocarpospora corrugata]|uniref:hypothetical protein n=1 Tax=Acrocarpospora corrugata TaxID=35763 RepID=UPI0012D303F2|nr:hypothetical protein [Acrocarpospora corrugata]
MTVPTPGGRPYVCDGGIETDLIYHHGAATTTAPTPSPTAMPGRCATARSCT